MGDLRDQVDFLGGVAANLPPSLVNPKRMRWPEVRHVFELAGANAVPIVSLVSLLLGFIIAFESAQRLAEFGAQIYVANTITVVMVREMGPLMTAILLAGRSASAFAAEIGTMKVNEELNALETLGLSPIRFLVVPRIVAGILVAPLLTCYSILMGVVGGALVMLGLGFSLMLILHQMASSVQLSDVAVGIEQRRGVRRHCFRRGLLARTANAARAERRRPVHHPSGRDQPPADHHGRRLFFHHFLLPKMMNERG